MHHRLTNWVAEILKWGLITIALGVVMVVAGLVLPVIAGSLVFIGKLMTAIGLMLVGLGIVSLLQYAFVSRDPKAGKQMMVNERDERTQSIRDRAGHRAYWISSALAFAVLMWASFAGDIGLPALSGDVLWFSLATVVIAPSIVYITRIIYEHGHR